METDSIQQAPTLPQADGEIEEMPGKDERMWAMFCHLACLTGYVVPVPFASVIGPLVVWMIKKDTYAFVNEQGKEAINFQISVAIYLVISALLILVIIGIPLIIALGVFDLVCVIIAAVQANEGKSYKYPLCIRFIK